MNTPKYMPLPKLQKWLDEGSQFIEILSTLAQTSGNMYRQWVTGRRGISASKAGAIEAAMEMISHTHDNAPEPLTRGDLCEACQACSYFKSVMRDRQKGES